MRLAYLSMHPAPYEDAFLSLIDDNQSINTNIFFLVPNAQVHLYWKICASKYNSTILSDWSTPWWKLLVILLRKVVFQNQYDLVLWPGYGNKAVIFAVFISALMGIRYGIKADSIREEKRSMLARLIKKYIIHNADVIFVPGAASREFFLRQ